MRGDKECIRAAAILYNNEVYEGTRHVNIVMKLLDKFCRAIAGRRGFMTNTGRFVDRAEAARIAWVAGQTNQQLDLLHSEDIRWYGE